ncbi:hypothetical protein [Absidia glauca]|uniref:Cation efflux protein cytoplasmic domain-containing protein n=1 Tax=Absidia glauca TaxID=4829 RepID=A0A168R5H4_ABSGL|nr:hypothetical protein [Absidia glauca]
MTENNQHSERTPLIKHTHNHNHRRSPSRTGSVVSYQDVSCANVSEQSGISSSTKKKLWFATGLALVFFATELVAGYLANSLALFSDAFHLLSDVVSFLVALVAIYLAEKPPTSRHTYGFHRAEVIAALVSVITIWILTAFLVREAIERIKSPQPIDAKLMCITASIGVVINIILAYVLGGHHHGHSHDEDHSHEGHSHSHSDHDEETSAALPDQHQHKKEANINLRAAALHVIGDLLASIGILISSIVLLVNPKLTIVDPICTFIFSLLVLYTTYHLVKDSLAVLMEGVPRHIQPEQIEKSLLQVPGVVAVHDLHVWVLSPGKSSLTAHISIERDAFNRYDEILTKSQRIICDMYGVHHSTLQIESDQSNFQNHCRPQISLICDIKQCWSRHRRHRRHRYLYRRRHRRGRSNVQKKEERCKRQNVSHDRRRRRRRRRLWSGVNVDGKNKSDEEAKKKTDNALAGIDVSIWSPSICITNKSNTLVNPNLGPPNQCSKTQIASDESTLHPSLGTSTQVSIISNLQDLSSVVEQPNHVIQHQRYFQAPSKTPLWLKGPRDKVYAVVAFTAIGVGVLGVANGVYRMVIGKD